MPFISEVPRDEGIRIAWEQKEPIETLTKQKWLLFAFVLRDMGNTTRANS